MLGAFGELLGHDVRIRSESATMFGESIVMEENHATNLVGLLPWIAFVVGCSFMYLQEMSFSMAMFGTQTTFLRSETNMISASFLSFSLRRRDKREWDVRAMVVNGACVPGQGLCQQPPQRAMLPHILLARFDDYVKAEQRSILANIALLRKNMDHHEAKLVARLKARSGGAPFFFSRRHVRFIYEDYKLAREQYLKAERAKFELIQQTTKGYCKGGDCHGGEL